MRHALMVGSLLFVAVAAGCSSSPALRTESSTSAIRAAEEVGASEVPRASLHLQLAKEELDRARTLSDNGKKDEAASQLLRAEADAELAVLLSGSRPRRRRPRRPWSGYVSYRVTIANLVEGASHEDDRIDRSIDHGRVRCTGVRLRGHRPE